MDFSFLHNSNYIPTCLKDYCLLQQLGRGAFGDVFRAVPLKGELKNTNLALKIINKTKLTSQTRRQRIINEISIHSSLKRHKNILNFYASFEDHQNVYIVTQLCSQGSLYSFIQTQSSLPLQEDIVKGIMKEIVSGLVFLHSHKIVHRDLKLSNILLDENNVAKIADFGLSIVLQNFSDEETMTLCGTPNYISPEIIAHKPSGLASDIWSLGCIFFCLLDKSPPFQLENTSKTLVQVINENLRQLPPCVSYEARNLIDKMLQKNPSDRIKTHQILKHPFFTSSDPKKKCDLNQNYESTGNYTFSSNFEKLRTTKDISKYIKHISKRLKKKNAKMSLTERLSDIMDTPIITTPEKKILQRIENILNENKNIIYDKKKKIYSPIKNYLSKYSLSSNFNNFNNNNIGYKEKPSTTYYTQNNMNIYKNDEKFNNWNINKEKNEKKCIFHTNFYKEYINPKNEYFKTQSISYTTDSQKLTNYYAKDNGKSQSKAHFLSNTNHKKIPIKLNSNDFKNIFSEKETTMEHNLYKINQNFNIIHKNHFVEPISDFAKKYHFNTIGLNVIKQKTKHADLEITKKGYLRLFFHNMDWQCLINSDGIKIKIIHNNKLPQIYELDDLPAKYLKAYQYASKFISILKSKMPKIILDTPYTKCRLYLNSSMVVQLDSKKQIIKIVTQNNQTNEDILLYEGNIESACKKFPKIISDVINRYKKCLSLEKNTEDDIIGTYAKFISGKGWWQINKEIGIMMFLDGSQLQIYFKPDNSLGTQSISYIKFINNNTHEIYELNSNKTIPEIVKKKLLILKNYGLL
ncbi:unnamed protein product [Pneumocystis jirovecii]|uniref:Polo kinase n=1 Tax=Pneumocystis jirovecii TaxID=42068 RepID=L0PB86_PNEJI|nr:unnamed protein product [Pneumocystis jirovecii]